MSSCSTLLREPLWLDAASLTEQRMEEFHAALLRWRPKVIQAYARSAVLFARFLRERGLTAYKPHSIVTSAEMLEPDDRQILEDVFGCPVFDRYGCREVSVIASECPAHTGLHVNAECLHVEIETPDGPADPGEVGAILVTDLLNTAMPLIRYRIGDLGSLTEGDCPCGRGLPRLAALHGRSTDFLVGSDGRLVSGVFLATYVVAQRPSLGQVQISPGPGRAVALQACVRRASDFDLARRRPRLPAGRHPRAPGRTGCRRYRTGGRPAGRAVGEVPLQSLDGNARLPGGSRTRPLTPTRCQAGAGPGGPAPMRFLEKATNY